MKNYIKNILKSIKIFILKFLYLNPIYRIDILEYVKNHHEEYYGICEGIEDACCKFQLGSPYSSRLIIPKLSLRYAKNFSIREKATEDGFWWKPNNWDTGRLDFLNWLINEYKDDKTDLRYLVRF